MSNRKIKFPCTGLIISGGHTTMVLMSDYNKMKLLGQTRDDAAGEAFDKAAKVLNLGYPGGPVIERLAQKGNAEKIDFPKSYLEKGSFDFSFSGVKTALLYYARSQKPEVRSQMLNDICASFQKAVFDVITDKAISACVQECTKQLLVGGGVSINKALQKCLNDKAKKEKIEVIFPKNELCTDNAAMVAAAGYRLYKEGMSSDYNFDAEPNLGL